MPKWSKGGNRQPKWSLSFSVRVGEGNYKKGPSIGLWPAEEGPMARGTTKGEYAEKLAEFFERYASKSSGISVSLFENDGKFGKKKSRDDDDEEERSSRRKRSRDDDDDEEEDEEEEEEDDEEDEDEEDEEEEDEEEEKPAKKKKAKKAVKKATKKKRKLG
jgi:hypothetical protein